MAAPTGRAGEGDWGRSWGAILGFAPRTNQLRDGGEAFGEGHDQDERQDRAEGHRVVEPERALVVLPVEIPKSPGQGQRHDQRGAQVKGFGGLLVGHRDSALSAATVRDCSSRRKVCSARTASVRVQA